MKYSSIIFVFTFAALFASECFGQDINAYRKAFKYLVNEHKGENIIVSDTICHIFLGGFDESISREVGKDQKQVAKRFDSIDWKQENFKLFDERLKRLHNDGLGPQNIIYFSNINDNLFCVELKKINPQYSLSRDSQLWSGQSMIYLFLWNSQSKKIREIARTKTIYN